MHDVLREMRTWDEPIALATVTATWGSAPRRVGSHMAFTADGRIAGSVSGGCVEGAVIEEGLEVLRTGRVKLLRYGVADEMAFEVVGLACGGSIEIFVQRLDPGEIALLAQLQDGGRSCARAVVIDGAEHAIGDGVLLGEGGVERFGCAPGRMKLLTELAEQGLADGRSLRREVVDAEVRTVFVDVFLPPPHLVIVGAVHIAQALAPLARTMGYRITVIDARSAFAAAERFPGVDDLRTSSPREALAQLTLTRSTAIVTLTHDARFDDAALEAALRSPAFYIGALGGRATAERRRERLAARGFTPADLQRIAGPIGLDIGARSPEEIALATMAQIVAARNSHP
jgi:xanthine dehydrogenase accessory factor